MTNTIRTQDGFTLVEILVSLSMMAIIMAGMAVATTSSLRSNAFSRDATAAASLMQDMIENVRSMDPNAIGKMGNGTMSEQCDATCDPNATSLKFTRTATMTQETPWPGLAELQVTVEWTAVNNTEHSISVVTYLCNASDCV